MEENAAGHGVDIGVGPSWEDRRRVPHVRLSGKRPTSENPRYFESPESKESRTIGGLDVCLAGDGEDAQHELVSALKTAQDSVVYVHRGVHRCRDIPPYDGARWYSREATQWLMRQPGGWVRPQVKWEDIKWYAGGVGYEDIDAVEDFMDWCDGEDHYDDYRFVRVGEDSQDVVHRGSAFDIYTETRVTY